MELIILLWVLYFIALYLSIFILSIFIFEPEPKIKAVEKLPKVSIIIPAWNEEKSIQSTVESALGLDYPKELLQIIAVDHGSDDHTGEILDSIKGVEITHMGRKVEDTKATAFNKGLEKVEGEFVACLDADSLIHPGALKSMLPYFESERVAVVTPIMLVKSPKNLLQRLQKYEYIVSVFIKRLMSHINCIYVAPGPFSIYRTEVLKKLGGFDENAIAEDMEIVYRLQKNHYIARQCLKGGYSYALAPATLKELYKQRRRWYGGSLLNLYQYKSLAFNKSYGDFGFFQMPKNIMGVVFVFTGLGIFFYYGVLPISRKIKSAFLINFNIVPYIRQLDWNPNIFHITNVHGMFVVIILFSITFFFFLYACYSVGEKLNKKIFPTLLVFFTAYPFLLSCMYLLVIIQKIRRKRMIWQKVKR